MVLVYSQCRVITTINFSTLLSPKEQTMYFPIIAFHLCSWQLLIYSSSLCVFLF